MSHFVSNSGFLSALSLTMIAIREFQKCQHIQNELRVITSSKLEQIMELCKLLVATVSVLVKRNRFKRF